MFSQNAIARFIVAAVLFLQIPLLAVRFSQLAADLSTKNLFYITAVLAVLSLVSYLRHKSASGVFLGTTAVSVVAAHYLPGDILLIPMAVVLAAIVQAAVCDHLQVVHAVLRGAPVLGHARRIAEELRPELQDWIIEGDTDGKPASRDDRADVYQKAKKELNDISLGTRKDYQKDGQIHIPHADFPIPDRVKLTLAPIVIGPNRRTPAVVYGRFGIGDMSYGSLGRAAVESLSTGAAFGLRFLNDKANQGSQDELRLPKKMGMIATGEGSATPYHLNGVRIDVPLKRKLAWGTAYLGSFFNKKFLRTSPPRSGNMGCGQIMWEIGSGKFGARHPDGSFDFEHYAEVVKDSRIVATKIKMAQGAKPGGGGILPGAKVTKEIASIRLVPEGQDCISPNCWDEFHDVPTLMEFIAQLQFLSGKPVGIKIVIGKSNLITEIAAWMAAHPAEGPDFIHVDGGEGGTGAAPLFRADYLGQSIMHSLPLVDNVLREHGVRDRVVLMSSGKVFNPAQLFIHLALGADYVFGARGFMFSLGCIQAKKCATGQCPTGVATHHKWLQRALVPVVKYVRAANYMEAMHKELIEMCRTVGCHDTFELNRNHLLYVKDSHERSGTEIHPYPAGHSDPRLAPTPATYGLDDEGHRLPAANA